MLRLYYHPLSSYCWKALIAIDVLGADVELHAVDPSDAEERALLASLSPFGKIPLLVEQGRPLLETSILIEHLQLHHARSAARLIPEQAAGALEVRLWDRLMDQYVMTPMQALTSDLLRPEAQRDPVAVVRARDLLATSYGVLERQLEGRTWLASEDFSLADCAAAPALFYANAYVPFGTGHPRIAAYFERLMEHPAIAGVIRNAAPFFRYFPGHAGLAPRFLEQQG